MKEERESLTVDHLPDEVLLHVFKWATAEELVSQVRFACRRWQVLSRDPYLWRSIHSSMFSIPLEEKEDQENGEHKVSLEEQCLDTVREKYRLLKAYEKELGEAKKQHDLQMLFWACKHGFLPELRSTLVSLQQVSYPLKTAINSCNNILRRMDDYCSPLLVASMNGHVHILKELLNHVRDPKRLSHKSDKHLQEALQEAASRGHTKTVELLLNTVGNHQDQWGLSPLSEAAASGHLKTMEVLLKHGEQPYHKVTALKSAVKTGNVKIVDLLLQHSAATKENLSSVLKLVKDKPVMKMLYDTGIVSKEIWNEAFEGTCKYGTKQQVELLLSDTFCLNKEWPKLRGLYYACSNKNSEVLAYLLKKGADPTQVVDLGIRQSTWPVTGPCYSVTKDIVKQLLNYDSKVRFVAQPSGSEPVVLMHNSESPRKKKRRRRNRNKQERNKTKAKNKTKTKQH